jgi:hypothetical protein
MPAPFDGLEDRLLRGGIAPWHVKRYLRELSEHLADLTQAQREAGFDEDDAVSSARAALGPDAELADAMLRQRDFRSLSARFPWLVFGVLPPLAVILGFLLWAIMIGLLGLAGGAIVPHRTGPHAVPAWYNWTGTNLMFVANFLIGPLLAWALALMAQRQRLRTAWPLLAIVLIATFGVHALFKTDTHNISIGLTSALPVVPRPLGGAVPVEWPIFLGQALMLCPPLLWLLHKRRKTGAPQ